MTSIYIFYIILHHFGLSSKIILEIKLLDKRKGKESRRLECCLNNFRYFDLSKLLKETNTGVQYTFCSVV